MEEILLYASETKLMKGTNKQLHLASSQPVQETRFVGYTPGRWKLKDYTYALLRLIHLHLMGNAK